MFHSHSNCIWAKILFMLGIVSLFMLLLLVLTALLVKLQHFSFTQQIAILYFTGLNANY